MRKHLKRAAVVAAIVVGSVLLPSSAAHAYVGYRVTYGSCVYVFQLHTPSGSPTTTAADTLSSCSLRLIGVRISCNNLGIVYSSEWSYSSTGAAQTGCFGNGFFSDHVFEVGIGRCREYSVSGLDGQLYDRGEVTCPVLT